MILKTNKSVVVGAATGIGAALAALLRAKGATVVGMDCEEIEGSSSVTVDLARPESIESAVRALLYSYRCSGVSLRACPALLTPAIF